MHKVFKYRLYPTKAQEKTMERILELCRMTYNETLAYRKDVYEQEGKTVSNFESHNLLPQWKKEYQDLKNVFSQTLQDVQERVDLAYRHFFRRVKNGENPGFHGSRVRVGMIVLRTRRWALNLTVTRYTCRRLATCG